MRKHLREILVVGISLLAIYGINSGLTARLDAVIYFASFGNYLKALGLGLVFLMFTMLPKLRDARIVLLFLQVFILGFLGSEVLYRLFHPKLTALYPDSPYFLIFYHLDYYFFHRLYQVVPLGALLLLFFSYPRKSLPSYLRFGSLDNCTALLRSSRNTWRKVTLFFIGIVLAVFVLYTIFSLLTQTSLVIGRFQQAPLLWMLIVPIALYGGATALLEESFFRAIFLPVFAGTMPQRGNLYQALFFGTIHFDAAHPERSLLKLVIFSFIGWIWGKAAQETGGIGGGALMHFAILLVLEMRIWFFL